MMLDVVKSLNAELAVAAEEVCKYCTAEEVPLDWRWAVALEASWAFKEKAAYIDFDNLLETRINWCSDFGIHRYETQNLLCDEFVQMVAEATWPEEERTFSVGIYGAKRVTVDEIKEQILQAGYRSFVNDW